MPHSILAHTADTGVEAWAASLSELVAELATGMFELMADVEPGGLERRTTIGVRAASTEELVVDALAELLYVSEVEELMLCSFEVTQPGPGELAIMAGGVDASRVVLRGPPIKAVTYHDLTVTREPDGWYGRVYFDV